MKATLTPSRQFVVIAGLILSSAVLTAQRAWIATGKESTRSTVLRAAPRAVITGPANGIYCSNPVDNAVGVHDLGGMPAGISVTVTVEGFSEGFDPVAAVVVATVGEKAGNTIKTTTFYDNDSGGEQDALIQFVTPQSGSYILIVGDYTDTTTGCYRYQVATQ